MPIGQYDPIGNRHRTKGVFLDSEGWSICVHCGERIAKGRRLRWHQECVQDHKIRSGGSETRCAVHERDHGICAICRVDCDDLERRFRQAVAEIKSRIDIGFERRGELLREAAESMTESKHLRRALMLRYHLWEADHIVPKSEGGGYCTLDNLRTLCKACHAAETGRLRKRLNERKRAMEDA